MNMVLAIDHRANDGAEAAAFLRAIKSWLEDDRARDARLLTVLETAIGGRNP